MDPWCTWKAACLWLTQTQQNRNPEEPPHQRPPLSLVSHAWCGERSTKQSPFPFLNGAVRAPQTPTAGSRVAGYMHWLVDEPWRTGLARLWAHYTLHTTHMSMCVVRHTLMHQKKGVPGTLNTHVWWMDMYGLSSVSILVQKKGFRKCVCVFLWTLVCTCACVCVCAWACSLMCVYVCAFVCVFHCVVLVSVSTPGILGFFKWAYSISTFMHWAVNHVFTSHPVLLCGGHTLSVSKGASGSWVNEWNLMRGAGSPSQASLKWTPVGSHNVNYNRSVKGCLHEMSDASWQQIRPITIAITQGEYANRSSRECLLWLLLCMRVEDWGLSRDQQLAS